MAPESDSTVNCSICKRPLTLLQPETCTDDQGNAVHSDCYVQTVATGKPPKPETPIIAA
jgi:hypothetical protein